MIEKMVDVPTADGKMDAFVVHPDEGGPFPSVVHPDGYLGPARGTLRHGAPRCDGRLSLHPAEFLVPQGQGAVRVPQREGQDALDARPAAGGAGRDPRQHGTGHRPHGDGRHRLGAEFPRRRAGARKGPKGIVGYCLGGRLAHARRGANIRTSSAPRRACTARTMVNDSAGFAAPLRRQVSRARSTAASPRRITGRRRPPSRRWRS